MEHRHLLMIVSAFGFVTSAFAPQRADARSVGAMEGNSTSPLGNAGGACLSETNGGVVNTCSSQQTFEVGLPIDFAGPYTVTFESTNGTVCAAQVFNQTNGFVGSSGFVTSNGGLTTLTSAAVPNGGILYIYCGIPGNAALYSINWF